MTNRWFQRATLMLVAMLLHVPMFAQNYSLSFDGAGEYVDLGNHSSLDVNHISVEFMMKASTGTFAYSNVVDKSHDGTIPEGWGFEFDASGQKLNFYYMTSSSTGSVTSTSNLDDDTWHHIAATYNGTKAYLYVDGVKQDSNSTVTGNLNSTTGNLYLAAWKGTGRWFPGLIEEVRIWDNALTSTMINDYKDYEVDAAHPNRVGTDHLVAYYRMSDGSGTTLTDNSTNSNTGTLSGGMDDANWIGSSPLPLELLYFEHGCTSGGVDLHWATATEYNVSHFEVWASITGKDFDKLATVQAVGNTQVQQNYSAFIKDQGSAYRYYQLKEIDQDGSIFDLALIQSDCFTKDEPAFSFYPNPAIDRITIHKADIHLPAELKIFSIDGRELYSRKMNSASMELMLSDVLPHKGIYFLHFRNGNNLQVQKLVYR